MSTTHPDTIDRRRIEDALIRSARKMTAERGLDGFTADELCEAAGIAAGSFGAYFESKEHAVIGFRFEPAAVTATMRFLTGGDGLANDLGPNLLEELTDMAVERWEALGVDPRSVTDLAAAIRREPGLGDLIAAHVAEQERFDMRVIVHREDLPTDDPRAEAASLILGRLVRESALDAIRDDTEAPFADILRRRVAAAQAFFATQAFRS